MRQDDGFVMASAGPHANYLHLASNRTVPAVHFSVLQAGYSTLPDDKPTVSKL